MIADHICFAIVVDALLLTAHTIYSIMPFLRHDSLINLIHQQRLPIKGNQVRNAFEKTLLHILSANTVYISMREAVSVIITVYVDKSFDFITKTPPVSELIKKKIGLAKGSGKAGTESAGSIKWSDVEEIAKAKMVDLNAFDIEAAKKIVAGSARSMGLTVID